MKIFDYIFRGTKKKRDLEIKKGRQNYIARCDRDWEQFKGHLVRQGYTILADLECIGPDSLKPGETGEWGTLK